jgi:predicted DNA-binding transcriptional regulator YafY
MDDQPKVGAAGAFEPPAGFDPASAFPDEPWRLGEGEVVPAEVLVDQLQAPLVQAELGESAVVERRRDGSVVVRMEVANEDAFRSWVLGLLDHAVVIGPEPLRRRVRQWLEAFAGPGGWPKGSAVGEPVR